MRKQIISALTLLMLAIPQFLWSQGAGNIKRGERPPIDLKRISRDSYYPNMIQIKVSKDYAKSINAVAKDFNIGLLGVEPIDQLNKENNAVRVNRTFKLYSALKGRYEQRHNDWGLNLWFEVEFKDTQDVISLVESYRKLKEVEIAEPVFKIKRYESVKTEKSDGVGISKASDVKQSASWAPNDPRLNEQWHYMKISLPEAWDFEKGNSDVIVAVIDGGVDYNHPDIMNNMWPEIGYNFVNDTAVIIPEDHATHVAGTIAAVSNNGVGVSGIAGGSGSGDGVKIMSCQVFSSNNSGGFATAPIWAADHGAVISQNSWGYTDPEVYDQATLDAIDYFNQNAGTQPGSPLAGGITIFAAGNEGKTGNYYPGCYSGAFSVAATNPADVRSYYSNYGGWVDISAPGGEQSFANDPNGILSTIQGGNYGFMQGTSMACPHVSGVAALVVSHLPGLITPDELKTLLQESSDDHYSQNPIYVGLLGAGRLNAYNAITEAETYLTGLTNPSYFDAEAISSSEVLLSWTRNNALNDVVLAYNTIPEFGMPDSTLRTGDSIPGGGFILYTGSDTVYNHLGLQPATKYYYRIWSISPDGQLSPGKGIFATTLCTYYDIPFVESLTSLFIPVCWSQSWEGSGTTSIWSVSNTNIAGGEAPEFLAYWSDHIGTSHLVTPAINTLGVNALTLSFMQYYQDYFSGVTFKVQTSNDGVTWTDTDWSFDSGHGDIEPSKVEFDIKNNLNSQTTYISFTIIGNHYNFNYWLIDNIEIKEIPVGSPELETQNVTNIDHQSAVLHAEIASQGSTPVTASGFVYSIHPFPAIGDKYSEVVYSSPVGSIGDFSSKIEGLYPVTRYYYRAFASNDVNTKYGSTKEFYTICEPQQLPYIQEFTNNELPACWQNINNGGTPDQIWNFGSIPYGLANSTSYAFLDSDGFGGAGSQNADLITPLLSVEGYDTVYLSFNHYFRQYESASTASLYYSVDQEPWQLLKTWTATSSNPEAYNTAIKVSPIGSYIRFKWNFTGAWAYYWCVDDVNITAKNATGLPVVQTLAAKNISSTTAVVNGKVNPLGERTAVFFEWGMNSVEENTVMLTDSIEGSQVIYASHEILNLLPGKKYLFNVYANNRLGISYGEVDTLHTLNGVPVPGNLSVKDIMQNQFIISGAVLSTGGVNITKTGLCIGTTQNPTTEQLFLPISAIEGEFEVPVNNMEPNTTYHVRLYLENELGSVYGDDIVVQTKPLGIPGNSNGNLRVYPNPVSDGLVISHEAKKMVSLTVFDIIGKEIVRKEVGSTYYSMDVSSWNNGIYLVKVVLEDGLTLQARFVKK